MIITEETRIGISSACFYPEDATNAINRCIGMGFKNLEIFLNTFSELEEPYLKNIAALCRVVAECADQGDADACAILVQAGQELAQMAATLLSRAPVPHALPLALGGGLVTQNAIVRASLEDRLQALGLPVSAVLELREPTRGVLSIYRNMTNGGLIL